MSEPLCFLNGQTLPLSQAKLSVLDLGILRGFGIYEGITSFGGVPFHFSDHWERFARSASSLGLLIPYTQQEALEATKALIETNTKGTRASVRMLLTGGTAIGGLEHRPGSETFFITCDPTVAIAKEVYEQGASLITFEHQRFQPELKTTNYITAVTLQERRKAAGAIEILYHHQNQLLECATSNVFIVKDGIVSTPDKNILPGITRKVALELARTAGYNVEERAISMDEVWNTDEVFITSSFKDIVPVVSIDAKMVGGGVVGPVVKNLMKLFEAYAHR